NNVDFGTGATNFQARVASATSGGNIELRLDSTNGTLVGTCVVPGTGGWQTWTTASCAVSGATGIHTVFLRFTGGSGYLFNVNWWKFGGPTSPVALPATPAGLVAAPRSEKAVLRWNAASGATGYNVKRATTSGGAYTPIATVAGTNYTDTTAIGGTTYYYVVSAANLGGESADSTEAGVMPTVDVPSPWLTQDVGAVGLAGWASFTNGTFTVSGAGADIVGASDQFRFVYLTNSGDCTIIARVASLEDYINSWSKAGVMIRQSLDPNAANAFIAMTPTTNGVAWQYRSSTGGTTYSSNAKGFVAPYWVKLVRSGNTFIGSYSANGTSWTQLGSAPIAMGGTVYVGLAITSHNTDTLCTTTFDHVTGTGWAPALAPVPTSLTATAGVERVTLSWTGSTNATTYNVKRATTSGGPYTMVATVSTTNYTDTAVIPRTTYYYVVSALNNLAGESADSAQAGATPLSGVPLPWMSRDIGTVGLSGSAGYTNGIFTVRGSGDDIWNSADAFRFIYVATNSTSFSITARVLSVQNVDVWSKAGVMVRASLDANAANAFVAVTPAAGNNGVSFQYRSSTGGGSANNNTTGLAAPYWVRLVRNGNTFTAYRSPNGVTWTSMGSTVLTNITTAYVGLAVTAHSNSGLCTATFDNVTLPGWPPPLLSLDAVALSSTLVGLTWNEVAGATGYNLKRSIFSGGPYTSIATGLTVTNYANSVASVRNGYYYVVSAMVGASETNSPEATVRFPKLSGTIIGTPGSWNNLGDTIAKVFDGDLNTFFDAPIGNGAWVGLDFGSGVANVITRISYCPRAGSESRMVGGIFQGANQANFSDAVALNTVTTAPAAGVFTSVNIGNLSGFRYVRFLSPNDGFGNVAELEFYGYQFSPLPPAAVGVALTGSNLALSWPLACEGFTLQARTNLVSGEWMNVGSPAPQIINEQWQVLLPPPDAEGPVFYRLIK
ncbi:MAG TPA: carbohydrate-binding protein, partial [Candidatus Paceibacterota bacterium]|nr:carbohydrate-binding protein [Candidatus Paceibacterota bacterium]